MNLLNYFRYFFSQILFFVFKYNKVFIAGTTGKFKILLTILLNSKDLNSSHGVKNIISKSQILKKNVSNKNDVLKLIGYQPLIDPFDKNLWSYFEIVIEKNKLGKKKFKKN